MVGNQLKTRAEKITGQFQPLFPGCDESRGCPGNQLVPHETTCEPHEAEPPPHRSPGNARVTWNPGEMIHRAPRRCGDAITSELLVPRLNNAPD